MTAVAMAFVRSAALAVIIALSGGTRRACLNTAHTPQSRFPPVGIVSLQRRSDDMGVFRVNKNKNYTVMSNVHLRDKALPLKAKGLLSLMLSLPEDWDYSMRGLAKLSADGLDSTRAAVKALERSGYVVRRQLYDSRGPKLPNFAVMQRSGAKPRCSRDSYAGMPLKCRLYFLPAGQIFRVRLCAKLLPKSLEEPGYFAF